MGRADEFSFDGREGGDVNLPKLFLLCSLCVAVIGCWIQTQPSGGRRRCTTLYNLMCNTDTGVLDDDL